jgi:hypothetical protein
MAVQNKPLLKKGSTIFIPNDLKNITFDKFDDKTIL